MDPAQGRGWAVVKRDELHGMIFFQGGDVGVRSEEGAEPEKAEAMTTATTTLVKPRSATWPGMVVKPRCDS